MTAIEDFINDLRIGARSLLRERAHAKDVAVMVVRQGAGVAAVGIALGLVGAAILTRLMAHMLFHVTALDPITFGIAVATLFVAAMTACWVPARRAASVDPITALRND